MNIRSGFLNIFILFVFVFAFSLAPSKLFAGAWGQEKGKTFSSTSLAYYHSHKYWSENNHLVNSGHYNSWTINEYMEHGFSEKFTGGVNAGYVFVNTHPHHRDNGPGSLEAFGNYKYYKGDTDVASFQLLLGRQDRVSALSEPYRHDGPEIEPRLFYGKSWKNSWDGYTYMDSSVAYRFKGGHFPDQVRINSTLGRKTQDDKWSFIIQASAKIGLGNGEGERRRLNDYDLLNLIPSIAYSYNKNISTEFGVQQSVYGRNQSIGTEPYIALWVQF